MALQYDWSDEGQYTVMGIDSATGGQKFSVPVPAVPDDHMGNDSMVGGDLMIAGDGYAYVPYANRHMSGLAEATDLRLLRVNSSGQSDDFSVYSYTTGITDLVPAGEFNMFTNADRGILLTWWDIEGVDFAEHHMAITNGTGASVVTTPEGPDGKLVYPSLQAQDGSFVGTTEGGYMCAFDATGGVRWCVPGYYPQIATADGGVIATSGWASATVFDQNGNAVGQMAQLPTQSWTMNEYQLGSVDQVLAMSLLFAPSWAAIAGSLDASRITADFPKDSIADDNVDKILSPQLWKRFAGSHCAAVFKKYFSSPVALMPNYSLAGVEDKQRRLTHFYDLGNPGIPNLEVGAVTRGHYGSNRTLIDWLGNTRRAGTAYMGAANQTAVVPKAGLLKQAYAKFVLVHEVLLHAYADLDDDNVFDLFGDSGLWRPAGSSASFYISTWISTDCWCTPENPATNSTCTANTAQW